MNRLTQHVRSNVVAYLALFIALGGTGYAAASLPAGSVGSAQLRNHSIGRVKLDPSFISGSVRIWAHVSASGRMLAGSHGDGPSQLCWIAGGNQPAAVSGFDHFRQAADVAGDYRHPIRHGFERRQAPSFRPRRHDEQVQRRKKGSAVGNETGKSDVFRCVPADFT